MLLIFYISQYTIYAAKFKQTIIHQHIHDGKVRRIDRASVTIILCLHVLIARRILFILDMFIIFSEYRFYHLVNAILLMRNGKCLVGTVENITMVLQFVVVTVMGLF
jgi:hypothetical protein